MWPHSDRSMVCAMNERDRTTPATQSLIDQTIAEVRRQFADLSPEEIEAVIAEAVAAVRQVTRLGSNSRE